MRALRFQNGQLSVSDIAEPVADGEALVRVTLSGICNTDLEIARGYAGFEGTLGHEFVGVIESLSEARASAIPTRRDSLTVGPLTPGQRVVGEINAGCGVCDLCRAGDPRHCPKRTVLGIVGRDGAHAEFLKLPLRNLLPVPDEIPDERAVFTEPLAAAYGILERVSITEETRVAVEASGSPSGFALAVELLHPRGVLVLKSTFHGTTEIEAAPLVVNEISVVGSRCGRFGPALELLKQNAVDVDSLISEEFPLSDGLSAMRRAAERDVIKVLLRA